MNSSRRTFLQSAGTVAVTGAAISAPSVAEPTDKKPDFLGICWGPTGDDLTIHVYDQGTGDNISGATVHLEPRFNGAPLELSTGSDGKAVFSSGEDGRYDVEVSHQNYPSGGFLSNKNFTSVTLPQTVHCPL